MPCRGLSLPVTLVVILAIPQGAASGQPTFPRPGRHEPTEGERMEIRSGLARLDAAICSLPPGLSPDLVDDIAVFHKAAEWIDRLGEFFDKKDVATTLSILEKGMARARQLAGDRSPDWVTARGTVVRAYTSRVDGSIQPYAVVIPEGLTLSRENRARLDVVLHGRSQTLNEVRFIANHEGKPAPEGATGKLTLHVFGRTNNAYRWAGEADVFEAIEAVKRDHPIDDRRIVLRGFSMGGAGAWHLGLHHPGLWASVEAGAGFSETRDYARLKEVPEYQLRTLHIYDALDYAGNAFNVPMIGYGGEQDPQLEASTRIVKALEGLGYAMETKGLVTKARDFAFQRVVGAKTGHKVDPSSAKLIDEFHDQHAVQGRDRTPKRVRLVTCTLKYGRMGWLSIEALRQHHERAAVDAEIAGTKVVVHKIHNVAVLALDRHVGASLVVGGEELPLEGAAKGLLPQVYYRRDDEAEGGWRVLDYEESRAFEENVDQGKRRGLQGPIDEAFTGSFLCVLGTGKPWNPAVARWSHDRFARFQDDWRRFLRGDVRVKKDTEVNQDDIENHHLILFGDPGSNWLMGRVVKDLPLDWTRDRLVLGGETHGSNEHAPALISLNPLNPRRYVVINSGHTFGARDFTGTNALLYPRLGDWGVYHTGGAEGSVRASGFFDEGWNRRKLDSR